MPLTTPALAGRRCYSGSISVVAAGVEAPMEPGDYSRAQLIGTLVIVSLDPSAIVIAARSHTRGPILIRPDRDVEPGTIVA